MNNIRMDRSRWSHRRWVLSLLVAGAFLTSLWMVFTSLPESGPDANIAIRAIARETTAPREKSNLLAVDAASSAGIETENHSTGHVPGSKNKAGQEFKDPSWQNIQEWVRAAKDDPALRQELIRKYEKTGDLQTKAKLAAILTSLGTTEVKRLGASLLSSQDALKKIDGIRLLAELKSTDVSAKDRQQLVHVLASESNETVLQALILVMNPGTGMSPEETSTIVGRLGELAKNPSPLVRAAAVGSLPQWGEIPGMEHVILEALNDADAEVIAAAVQASTQAGIQTPAVKGLLFQLASRQDAEADFRLIMLSALGNYALDPQDSSRLAQLRKELGDGRNM